MSNRLTLKLTSALACLAAFAAGPVPAANATYRGRDGQIAFGMADSTGRHIYSVAPDGGAAGS